MPAERLIKQFVFMDRPEEVPVEKCDVVRQFFSAERFEVHLDAVGGALLLGQRRLRKQIN